jgi:hypothetical protein
LLYQTRFQIRISAQSDFSTVTTKELGPSDI